MKKLTFLAAAIFVSLDSFSQRNPVVGLDRLATELGAESQNVFKIVNIIMTMILFAGIIYIASALISKRETSKGVIVGWVIALAIWGIASAILTPN